MTEASAGDSIKVRLCLGQMEDAAACRDLEEPDTGDTADTGGGEDKPGGCACQHPGPPAIAALPLIALAVRRRSNSRASA